MTVAEFVDAGVSTGDGVAAVWAALLEAYRREAARSSAAGSADRPARCAMRSGGADRAAERAAQLIAAWVRQGRVPGDAPVVGAARSPSGRRMETRARQLAAQVLAAFAAEAGGLAAALERARCGGGFDWLRNQLEDRGFARPVAWRLCRAGRDLGLISAEPDRPYLAGRGLLLVQRLLPRTLLGSSLRDREAAFMQVAELRLGTGAGLGRLDAVLLSRAVAAVAESEARASGRG